MTGPGVGVWGGGGPPQAPQAEVNFSSRVISDSRSDLSKPGHAWSTPAYLGTYATRPVASIILPLQQHFNI